MGITRGKSAWRVKYVQNFDNPVDRLCSFTAGSSHSQRCFYKTDLNGYSVFTGFSSPSLDKGRTF